MTPIGYVSRREAIEIVAAAKFAGVPDRDVVVELRQQGIVVADGMANEGVTAEIWNAVDQDQLEAYIYGPGDRWLKMSAFETGQVPSLRSPRGGDFSFLRPGNPFHERVTAEFGPRALRLLTLVFRKDQVEKLARSLRRRHRRKTSSVPGGRPIGRPSTRDQVRECVQQQINENRWDASKPLKALVQLVQRSLKWDKGLSETTIARALDGLFEDNQDRKFHRRRRQPNGARVVPGVLPERASELREHPHQRLSHVFQPGTDNDHPIES